MKKTIYILVLIFLASCTSNTIYEKPKDLIPKDSMIYLLTDLYLATSAANFKNKDLKTNEKYMPIIFQKYNIDSSRFKTSNIYYLSKIDEYEKLFRKVRDSLKKLKIKFNVKEDSLKKYIEKNIKEPKIPDTRNNVKKEKLNKITSLKNRNKPQVKKTQ